MNTPQLAIALNQAGAEKDADMMIASMELARNVQMANWPKTLQRREKGGEADGWHGIILLDGTELIFDGWRWKGA